MYLKLLFSIAVDHDKNHQRGFFSLSRGKINENRLSYCTAHIQKNITKFLPQKGSRTHSKFLLTTIWCTVQKLQASALAFDPGPNSEKI